MNRGVPQPESVSRRVDEATRLVGGPHLDHRQGSRDHVNQMPDGLVPRPTPWDEVKNDVGNFLDYWSDPNRIDQLVSYTIEHTQLVLIVMAVAIPIAVALGVLAHRVPPLSNLVVSMAATFLTIPSLALFAILIYVVGLGTAPAAIGLILYAQLAIVRNTVSGLNSVPSAVSESAKGMGMGYWHRLARIEMPIAWPVVIAGIRVSTQLVVGIAAIGALVGVENLGTLIFGGIRRLGSAGSSESIIGGTIAIVALAFLFDLLFLVISRLTTSRGIRA